MYQAVFSYLNYYYQVELVFKCLNVKQYRVILEIDRCRLYMEGYLMKNFAKNLNMTENFFDLVEKRRAIRKYKNFDIPDEDLKKILNAARLAPSAENSQPWRFIVVKNQTTKELLAKPSTQSFIANANSIIVVLGDPKVSCCPTAQTWITRDPMIAAEHLVLAATALGYGTCWIANYESR